MVGSMEVVGIANLFIADSDRGAPLTCITFLGDSSQIATGSHSRELKIFDSNSNNVLESYNGLQFPLTIVQSYLSRETQLVVSSNAHDVRLWDASSVSIGPSQIAGIGTIQKQGLKNQVTDGIRF
ncbi:DDB1- and CUL4-associated factor homolog 1-like [Cornus florida]|uniref:DDB1- and CUL4-associated factor homolog 1-like n=1 Tax=Cornus florida TaxID=4283 RepID=UPI0028A154B8|nr:DDB1- and CUL4-associated factor homolog 1-like [Cornus florida]